MVNRLIVSALAHQGIEFARQTVDQRRKGALARQAAQAVGKPMLVVGGPMGVSGVRHALGLVAHECGDVCSDIDPYACTGCPNAEKADARALQFADKEFGAVLCSHVLEHMDTAEDCALAHWELQRVADQVFISVPSRMFAPAHLTRGHRLWVREISQGWLQVEERRSGRSFIIGPGPEHVQELGYPRPSLRRLGAR